MTGFRIARCALALAACAATVLPATAQERHGGQGALDELVAEALRSNASLAAERAAEAGTAARIREARARYLPSLQLDARYSGQSGTVDLGDVVNPAYAALNELTGSDRFPTDLELTLPLRHESRFRLTQPVFNEAIRGRHAAAREMHEAQSRHTRAVSRRIAAEVQLAYLDVAASRAAVRIFEAALCLVSENERVGERLVGAGEATAEVLFRARAERSAVEQQLAESSENAAAAVRALNRILGRPLTAAAPEIPDSLLLPELELRESDALASGLSRREELAQLDAATRAAEAGVRVAGAAFLPSVSVALDYGFQGRDLEFGGASDFVIGSLVLSWNVFNGGGDVARRDAARAEVSRLRATRRDAEQQVVLDVQQSYQAALVARSAMVSSQDRLLAAERTFDLVRRRFDEGLATHLEYVDARAALTSAELNHYLTKFRYAMRYVDLERAAALRDLD